MTPQPPATITLLPGLSPSYFSPPTLRSHTVFGGSPHSLPAVIHGELLTCIGAFDMVIVCVKIKSNRSPSGPGRHCGQLGLTGYGYNSTTASLQTSSVLVNGSCCGCFGIEFRGTGKSLIRSWPECYPVARSSIPLQVGRVWCLPTFFLLGAVQSVTPRPLRSSSRCTRNEGVGVNHTANGCGSEVDCVHSKKLGVN